MLLKGFLAAAGSFKSFQPHYIRAGVAAVRLDVFNLIAIASHTG